MYQTQFADLNLWSGEDNVVSVQESGVKISDIDSVLEVAWEEHCTECGYPDCYSLCALYAEREDKACRRFTFGIVRNPQFNGRYNYGADIKFKKWAKLECNLSKSYPRKLKRKRSVLETIVQGSLWEFDKGKNKSLDRFLSKSRSFDELVIECYSPTPESFKLTIEYFIQAGLMREPRYKNGFTIQPGLNRFSIPFHHFRIDKFEGYIYLYPEHSDEERRLIFTWLDFVTYVKRKPSATSASKVKCVAWDLDNTVWGGILVEEGQIVLREGVTELMDALDQRGILQTVVSKNDHDKAWNKLESFGIEKYFLYPAINWGPKSKSLVEISGKLNIGLDSFAVIDDSEFERAEILDSLKTIHVFKETDIGDLLNNEYFEVPVTEMSRKRRLSYIKESERIKYEESFNGRYDEFLLNCSINARVFIPGSDSEILRCWELIQRSNQLNLSSRRYSLEHFKSLLNRDNMILALDCGDRFGEYGIVGCFVIQFKDGQPHIEDFVLSCRVAQKKIEHCLLSKLSHYFEDKGYQYLFATAVKTARNYPIIKVFDDLPFEVLNETDTVRQMRLSLDVRFDHDIVKIVLDIP